MMIKDIQIFDIHAELCKAIANRTRLMIIALLEDGELSVSKIVESLDVSVTNVSQHLRILRNHHVVKTRKKGQTVYYSLVDPRLPKACKLIRTILLENIQKRNEMVNKFNKRGKK